MWRTRKVSSSVDVTTWFDAIRTFAPGPRKFALALVCLQTVAGALMVSTSLAFAIVVALAATLVKIYEVDTEPVVLIMTHTIISGCMLYDLTTTAAVIVVVVAAAVTFGSYDIPQERVVVFVSSSAVAVLFGKVLAVVISMAIAVVIVLTKLRPVQPTTLTLLTLGLLALSLLIDRVVGNLVVFLIIAIVTALFVVNRITTSDGISSSKGFGFSKPNTKNTSNNNNTTDHNSNSTSNAVPNGYLQLASPCDSLDLHGHTVTGAIRVLNSFLRESEDAYRENRTNHLRHVTIITGEGNPIDFHGPAPLLKPSVINFLKINKYKHEAPSTTPGLIRVDLESHVI